MNTRELFKEVTGEEPDFSTKSGITRFHVFKKLLDDYDPSVIKKLLETSGTVAIIKNTGVSWYNYTIDEVTPTVLVNHLEKIHKSISNNDLPAYWRKAMLKQAEEFINDFGKTSARFWMHQLDKFNFKGYIFEGFITFKYVRNWVNNER